MVMETGRVCMKTAGREAGRYCVVLDKVDNDFVMITGPKALTKVKRRKCNVDHLEPLPYKLKIKKDSSDSDVMKEYEKAKVLKKLGISKPAEKEIKEIEKKKKEKKAKKEETRKRKEEEKKKSSKKSEKKPEKAKKTGDKKAKE